MAVKGSNGADSATRNVAVVFGATGLVGKELVRKLLLLSKDSKPAWKVYGVARKPDDAKPIHNPNYHFISCDLLNPLETHHKLSTSLQDATHIFWLTWASQFPLDTQQCCDQNKTMISNVLNAVLLPSKSALKHFSLQTGTKHYVSLQGPFDVAREEECVCYYDEESPRASSGCNFYYGLEDLLRERLGGGRVAWSVHRPGLIMGSSRRTLFNFMGSLCVYGAICKRLKLPFVFGGRRECWEEMHVDGSDARMVAEQHIWAATDERVCSGDGEAFNAINGKSFTWKGMWPAIGSKFGIPRVADDGDMFSEDFMFSTEMGDKGGVWREIVEEEGLVKTEMEDLANWRFLDMVFRCPVKMLSTRAKVDRMGHVVRYDTLDSVLYWIDRMKDEKLIP
ncbi:Delta(4)-3-oxosteroid 5beta-reductase [Sarracenia purpurea var. burkii]